MSPIVEAPSAVQPILTLATKQGTTIASQRGKPTNEEASRIIG